MSEPIHLDPAAVLTATRARHRQQMAAAAQREADLLEEIANLEAYATQLQAALTEAPPPTSNPDPWDDTTTATPERNT